MAFNDATRREIVQLPTQSLAAAPGGNTVRVDLPRVGIAQFLFLAIRGQVVNGGVAPTGPNAFGFASIIRNVRLSANNGNDLFNMSGPGYHYLLRPYLELGDDPLPQSNARTAIPVTTGTTTAFNCDMIIPLAINMRDQLGLVMLQSDQTLLTLQVTFELLTNLQATNTGTWTCTVEPYLVFFTVPASQQDWPPFTVLHQIIEDTQAVPATGQYTYNWPRENIYLQVMHGMGFGPAVTTDTFNNVALRMQQSTFIQSTDVPFLDIDDNFTLINLQRIPSTFAFNLIGTSGLGAYDLSRDTIDSSQLTDLASLITFTTTGTLYTVRRQLVRLQPTTKPSGA